MSSNHNYTSICHYCGKIYPCRRAASKYCCKQHNSLYSKYGCQIKATVTSCGAVYTFRHILQEIYQEWDIYYPGGWSVAYPLSTIRECFEYWGPLPCGDEILLVGHFLI